MQGIEPLLQELRIWKVAPHIEKHGVLVDFGCDEEETLLRRFAPKQRFCIGIDVIAVPQRQGNRAIIRADLNQELPLPSNCATTVTMLAVLEHLKDPSTAVSEAFRILRPGGKLLLTVPSAKVERLLPLLAKVGLVRKEMIEQHENYFSTKELEAMAWGAGFRSARAERWELGCNIFLQASK
jgi:SAM-dependent methyltransferase